MCIVQLPAKTFLQVALSQTIQDEGVFEAASSTTETPGPEGVVEAFVKLIETPAGKRPFRTVPTAAIQPLLENYNALAATMWDTVAQIFQVPELTVLQQAGS